MIRKIVAVWVSLAMLAGFVVIVDVIIDFTPTLRGSNTLYVNETGIGAFSSIQDAIIAANPGDTVYVYSGTYVENVWISKTINLTGEDRDTTIIEGGVGSIRTIIVNADWVNITGFTITNGTEGIELDSSYNNITGNNISNNGYGIYLGGGSGNKITGNIVSSNYDGIYLSSSNENDITGNNVSNNNNGHGIYLWGSGGNNITNNNASNNSWGIYLYGSVGNNVTDNDIFSNDWEGIHIGHWSDGNNITDNIASNNTYGILIFDYSIGNNITGNLVSNNNYGIHLWDQSNNNIIKGNTVSSNNLYGIHLNSSTNNGIRGNNVINNGDGIYLQESSNNRIYHNNIIDNTNQAYDDRNDNSWDNGYPSGGNYWSDFDEPGEGAYDDYQGSDQDILGSDGIVDNGTIEGGGKNPYVIDSDSQDNYPLKESFINYMSLKQGWNLISLPLIQQEQSLINVLENIEGSYDSVQWYNNIDTNDPWKHHKVSKPFGNDLFELNETMGFWIHITRPGDTIFLYNGTQPTTNQSIPLHPGWNMVGYPSLINRNRTAALNNINFSSDVDAIWTFNAATKTWQEIGPIDYFELGRGYWIHSKVTKIWDVPL